MERLKILLSGIEISDFSIRKTFTGMIEGPDFLLISKAEIRHSTSGVRSKKIRENWVEGF